MLSLPCVLLAGLPPSLPSPALPFSSGSNAPDDWRLLDREIDALAQDLAAPSTDGPRVSGFLRVNYAHDNQIEFPFDPDGAGPLPAGTGDYSGFALDNARIEVSGDVEGWRYLVGFDFGGLTLSSGLIDAYVAHDFSASSTMTLGRFRPPFLRTALISEKDLLFITRTRNATFYSVRDLGAQLGFTFEELHLWVAGQDGVDGQADEYLASGRLQWDAIGGGVGLVEGAYGRTDRTHLTVGAAASNDSGLGGGETAVAVDAALTVSRLSLQAELVDYGSGYTSPVLFPGENRGDTTPWSVTASALILDWLEGAVRYENLDESGIDRQVTLLGLNWYVHGHDLKWQANYAYTGRDFATDEQIFALGLTLGF
jgi:hypothetical protein